MTRTGNERTQAVNDPVTSAIVTAAIKVHRALGPGLLESTYCVCLVHELRGKGMTVLVDKWIGLDYEGLTIRRAFRPDLIVDSVAIVELKHVEKLLPVHEAQLRTYMRLTGVSRGLILNFWTTAMKDGIRRLTMTT